MNQGINDQEWQQMQSRINKLITKYLLSDINAIEHKPRYLELMELPPQHQNNEKTKSIL